MKTLFFDVETSGLPDFNKRASDPSQPHLVQFAAVLMEDDKVAGEHCHLIKPDGWEIPAEVVAVHGITTEQAVEQGIDEKEVAATAFRLIREADLIVAHNITFDKFLCRVAARRHQIMTDDDDPWWKAKASFCTMRSSTDLCRLPGNYPGKFKWPRLSEAYKHFFGKDLVKAHDALCDVRACSEIYFELNRMAEPKRAA